MGVLADTAINSGTLYGTQRYTVAHYTGTLYGSQWYLLAAVEGLELLVFQEVRLPLQIHCRGGWLG